MLQRSHSLLFVAGQCGGAVKDAEIQTGSLCFSKTLLSVSGNCERCNDPSPLKKQ